MQETLLYSDHSDKLATLAGNRFCRLVCSFLTTIAKLFFI